MAFNLKLVLKALLFSSNQPLAIKDIQAVFTRYHEKAQALHAVAAGAAAGEAAEVPADEAGATALPATDGDVDADSVAPSAADEDAELYAEVPSLVTSTQIREAMDELAAELRAQNDIYLLIDGANGFRIVTRPRFARWVRTLRDEPPPAKLSQSALETLAVVAYRQPVTRSELESIRGVSCETVMNRLLERELVYVVGRADLPGRPLQFGTTDKFLEFVGVKSLVELPASDVLSPRQIDEWLNHTSNVSPPADAEMGLPLEEGEGASPSLNAVNIEHVEPTPAPDAESASISAPMPAPAAEPEPAPEPELLSVPEPAASAESAPAESESKPQPSAENA